MTRRQLRENIFKILFKLEFNSIDEMPEQLEFSLEDIEDIEEADVAYITDKTNRIISLIGDINSIIMEVSTGWQLDRIGKAELAILRLAVYEMKFDQDIPFKVAINEAVELSKLYCNDEARSFINGVLAKVEE